MRLFNNDEEVNAYDDGYEEGYKIGFVEGMAEAKEILINAANKMADNKRGDL